MWVAKLLAGAAVVYAVLVAFLYVAQTKLLFPAGLAGGRIDLPETAERLTVTAPDGARLEGVRLPAAETAETPPTLLIFGGNAWNAEEGAVLFHRIVPGAEIIAFHYRGYGPSTGSPRADAVMADALHIHDAIAAERQMPIIAVGLSLGAGPASYLASERPVAGLILATPFDSLTKLAKDHYFWVPVRPLLRHRMPVLDFVEKAAVPTAVILAENDRVVPAARSAAFQDIMPEPVLFETIAGAGHNDLYDRLEFAAAFRKALKAIEKSAP